MMPPFILLIVAAMIAGVVGGALAGLWLIRRIMRRSATLPIASPDPALSVEIDRAAAVWAEAQGRPEIAGLAANKMHLIHGIGQRRGWWK